MTTKENLFPEAISTMNKPQTIDREVRDGILIGTLNRPEVMNALNSSVLDELADLVTEFDHDPDLRILVLTGAGKAFVAGADISEMATMSVQEARAFSEQGQELCAVLNSMDKLVVAAVNGFALGGGCELALACDFVYASEYAKLGQPETKLGVIPGFGGSQRLARAIGSRACLELLVTGKIISAPEAKDLGLVNQIFPADGFIDRVCEELQPILRNGPSAVGMAKLAVYRGQDIALERALAAETEIFAGLFATEDQREGMKAFLQKREAEFTGH